jgi:hypothetical protein
MLVISSKKNWSSRFRLQHIHVITHRVCIFDYETKRIANNNNNLLKKKEIFFTKNDQHLNTFLDTLFDTFLSTKMLQ